MKLSMWMIANQLISLDPVLEISPKAPAVLNSARLAYATNCVYIFQEGRYVVCNGEGDLIKIPDMEINRVFELVQSIFDTYEDWTENLQRYLQWMDYQKFMDEACKLFKNPMVLLDANNKMLGMTRRYGRDSIDREWAYLWDYGFSSLNAIAFMAQKHKEYPFATHGQLSYRWDKNEMLNYAGMSNCLYFNNICCGRVNLLAKERDLNPGDSQLLAYISTLLEPYLGQMYYANAARSANSVFLNLISGKPYDSEKLRRQMGYLNWQMEDSYQLAVIQLPESTAKNPCLDAVTQLIGAQLPGVAVLRQDPNVLILANYDLENTPSCQRFFHSLLENNPVVLAFSLPVPGLMHIPMLYRQAEYALNRRAQIRQTASMCSFQDYAVDYMILSEDPLDGKVFACMPQVLRLWMLKRLKGDVLFDTLVQYLDHERSIARTSQAMFLHKNTGAYRIKKLESLLGDHLDDPKVRRYCQISLMVLELFERTAGPDALPGAFPFAPPEEP